MLTQYGVIPVREAADGRVEVLLITSRETRRWVVPKGWPIKGLKPHASAAREAFEEAGLIGETARRPRESRVIGSRRCSPSRNRSLRWRHRPSWPSVGRWSGNWPGA